MAAPKMTARPMTDAERAAERVRLLARYDEVRDATPIEERRGLYELFLQRLKELDSL